MDADDIELANATVEVAQRIYNRAWRVYSVWALSYMVLTAGWAVAWVASWWHPWLLWGLIPSVPALWAMHHWPLRRAQRRFESTDAFLFPGHKDKDEDE